MNTKQKIEKVMQDYGYFYNIDEVLYHIPAGNISHLDNADDQTILEWIENAANIIDLNSEED